MCGEWGAAKCTPRRWFRFMGDVKEDFVPFQINYRYHNASAKGFTPFSPKVVPCNESLDGISPACSCVDCASSCPKPPQLEAKAGNFHLWRFDNYAIEMFIVFIAGSSMFVLVVLCCTNEEKQGKSIFCSTEKIITKQMRSITF